MQRKKRKKRDDSEPLTSAVKPWSSYQGVRQSDPIIFTTETKTILFFVAIFEFFVRIYKILKDRYKKLKGGTVFCIPK